MESKVGRLDWERLPGGAKSILSGYLARLGPSSRVTMLGCLSTICRGDPGTFRWEDLRREHTLVIRGWLVERYAPATAAKHLAALRGVLREAWRSGRMEGDMFARAIDLPAVRGNSGRAGRALEREEVRRLIEYVSADGMRGARDGALLALLYGAGLRVAEACGLEFEQVTADRKSLTIRGKGSKLRTVWLVAGADALLARWLQVRGDQPGAVLLRVRMQRIEPHAIGTQAVLERCAWLAKRAGVASFTPHDLRRSYASDLIDAGADLSIVQQLMGHSKVTTTQQYDRRGERSKASAAAKVRIGE
jgi:site-specific recombinase XerD